MKLPTQLNHNQPPKFNLLALNQYNEEYLSNLYNITLGQVKCIMAVVNQAANSAMLNAYEQIQNTPLFRNRTKQGFKAAIKEYERYEARLRYGNAHDQQFFSAADLTPEEKAAGKRQPTDNELFEWWLDIGACAYEKSHKESEMLRIQILQSLTYKKVEYPNELSYVCHAATILRYAADMFDILMRDFRNLYHLDFTRCYRDFSLRPVYELWRKTTEQLCELPEDTELTEYLSNNINLAFKAFESAVMRDLLKAESANEAITQNSHILEPDVYEEYQKDYAKALQSDKDKAV